VEAAYEFEHLANTDGGSTANLRRQEYWSMLSGATGQLYGSAITWRLEPGWQFQLDSPGVLQLLYLRNLFAPLRWYELVPDQTHSIVTGGYGGISEQAGHLAALMGSYSSATLSALNFVKRRTGWGSVTTNGYATTAATSDGSLSLTYLPSRRTVVVDMSRLMGPAVRARWYDPTDGSYHSVMGSPFLTVGSREFAPPGENAAGDGDWLLLLQHEPDR
jgi:hypothetical protein